MINYYHRFIPNAAGILTPLYHLSSTKEKQLEDWNQTHELAFTSANDSLAQVVMLATSNGADNLFLVTYASNIAIGAVLEHGTDGHRRPLGFFSGKLNTPQQKYSTFDRELLAVHSAIRHFRHMLKGTSYTICTDHKPLVQHSAKLAMLGPVGNNVIYQQSQKHAVQLSIFLANKTLSQMLSLESKSQQSSSVLSTKLSLRPADRSRN